MGLLFRDPGPCPICGAPHHSCNFLATTGVARGADDAIVIDQLPASTATVALRATQLQARLPSGQFTTGTYRGIPPRRSKRLA